MMESSSQLKIPFPALQEDEKLTRWEASSDHSWYHSVGFREETLPYDPYHDCDPVEGCLPFVDLEGEIRQPPSGDELEDEEGELPEVV
jgi:hypothetical protein